MSATRILPTSRPHRKRSQLRLHRLVSSSEATVAAELALYYDALFAAYGPQHWWPGRTRFEVIVGAILTQNTSWSNVELAIHALRRENLLSSKAIERVSFARLSRLIRSSGYFRQKARKLKVFVRFLRDRHQGSLDALFATPTSQLREQLLGLHGIGPETADSILLYAGRHPVFVVDAYTRRILERHDLTQGKESYDDIQRLFVKSLPANPHLFNEYHALMVQTGKHFCRKRDPRCERCALRSFLPRGAEASP